MPAGRINPKPGYHTVRCSRSSARRSDQGGDIDTMWVQVTNPGQTLPNLAQALQSQGEARRQVPDRFRRLSDGDHANWPT